MKPKIINKKTIIVVLLIALTVLFAIQTNFKLFDEEPVEITQFKFKTSTFGIYYIPSNATQQEYIQVRKVFSKRDFKVLNSFERYQILTSYKLMDNDSLQFVLSDTASYRPRQDTLKVKIE
jgi:hypothetical protein